MKVIDKIKTALLDMEAVTLAKFEVITFKHGATGIKDKRKGYEFLFIDKISHSRWEITIEPKRYSNGDKWFVYGSYPRYFCNGTFYAKNLSQVFRKLQNK